MMVQKETDDLLLLLLLLLLVTGSLSANPLGDVSQGRQP